MTETYIPKPVVLTLLMVVFLDFLGFSIVLPYLYFYVREMGASFYTYGAIVAAYALMQVVCAPLFGKLSDLYGRRYVLVFTLIGSALSYLVFGYSNVLWLIFASRLLGGAFGSTYSIAQAYVADVTTKDSRLKYLGFLAGAYGLGYLIGPLVGGILSSSYGFVAPALLASFLAMINSVLTYAKFPATKQNIIPKFRIGPSHGLRGNKEQNLLLAVNFISTLIFVSLLVIVPPWLQAIFSFGALETGLILSYAGAISIITVALIVPRLSKRISSTGLVSIGFGIAAISYLGLSLVGESSTLTLSVVFVLAGLLSFGFSVIGPAVNSLISITGRSISQGETMGYAKSAASAAQVIAPAMATAFFSFGISMGETGLAFQLCMLISLATLPIVFLLRHSKYLGTWEQILTRNYVPATQTHALESA